MFYAKLNDDPMPEVDITPDNVFWWCPVRVDPGGADSDEEGERE